MWRRNENKLRKCLLTESVTLHHRVGFPRHQTSIIPDVSFRGNKCSPTSKAKYKYQEFKNNVREKIPKLKKDGARKKIPYITHQENFRRSVSSIYKIVFHRHNNTQNNTVSEANYALLHLKTSCLVSSIFVTIEKIPVNAADISHVRPSSKICMLLEISRGSTTVLKDSEIYDHEYDM